MIHMTDIPAEEDRCIWRDTPTAPRCTARGTWLVTWTFDPDPVCAAHVDAWQSEAEANRASFGFPHLPAQPYTTASVTA